MRLFDRRSELARRVARLGRVFPLDAIVAETMEPARVAEYYELSFGAYRRRHSSEGSLHLALNDGGRYDSAGFGGQAARLRQAWAAGRCDTVAELGFGQGYNLAALAAALPRTRLLGIDLTPKHVAHVGALMGERGHAHVELAQGDFHALPWPVASLDHAYSVEAFCYVRDLPRALAEVHRVLKPGGTLTLFDGYLTRPAAAMDPDEAMAVCLAAKGMALDRLPVADELVAAAAAAGLRLERRTVLDAEVAPNVRRFDRQMALFMRWPWLARRMLRRLNPIAMRNVLAGYLMGPAMARGVWTYLELVLRKDG